MYRFSQRTIGTAIASTAAGLYCIAQIGSSAHTRLDRNQADTTFYYPNEIQYLWRGASPEMKVRLISLFKKVVLNTAKVPDETSSENFVEKHLIVDETRDDIKIYSSCRKLLSTMLTKEEQVRGLSEGEIEWSLKRGLRRTDEILKVCQIAGLSLCGNDSQHDMSYLDIGCADGSITRAMGAKICDGEDAVARIHGYDLLERESALQHDGFTFHACENMSNFENLPFEDSSQDVITCLQVLHHVNDRGMILDEILRVLKPGGVLIIREHDARKPEIGMLCDVEHGLWRVMRSENDDDDFSDLHLYFGCSYVNFSKLNKELQSRGAALVIQVVRRDLIWNPTNCGYVVYVKEEAS